MIVLTDVDPVAVTTYHTEPADRDSKVARIAATDEYAALKASVLEKGVLDPVVMCVAPGRPMFVELGEQRVLAARELGLTLIPAIAYNVKNEPIAFAYSQEFYSMSEIEAAFSRQTLTVTRSGVCPECGYDRGATEVEIEVPALKMLRDYVAAGIASFGKEAHDAPRIA